MEQEPGQVLKRAELVELEINQPAQRMRTGLEQAQFPLGRVEKQRENAERKIGPDEAEAQVRLRLQLNWAQRA
ncbi:hypothetical protein CRG98_044937 [Punica granatum]|uniref:Uncharacterized protein n=1 Tax=Punica granatum TaxID=22663 RepID=A0A2I0HSJ1_PUNGR|nr:hypothetical protein CRG98_044937 [Punica granatum]